MQRSAYVRWVGGPVVALGIGAAVAIGIGCGIAEAETGASSAAGPRPHTSAQKSSVSTQRTIAKPAAAQQRLAPPSAPKATSPRTKPTIRPLAQQTTPPTVAQQLSGFVQTAIGRVFNNFLRITQGPARLPPGSTVTVHSAGLQLPCDNANCRVTADWYFPDDPNPKGVIYLQHGSLTNASMYSYTAAKLAQRTDSIVVAPTITDFYDAHGYWLGGTAMQQAVAELFSGDRGALTASASTAAGHAIELPEQVVLVGHSAGGDLVTGAGAEMVSGGWGASLVGVILLDGYTADPKQFTHNVKTIPVATPVLLIGAPPSYYNQLGAVSSALVAARPGTFTGLQLKGGTHVDGMQGGNPLTQFAESLVAGFPTPQNTAAVGQLSADWINDMLDGDTIPGTPGQTVQVQTAYGTATGYTLPAPPTTPSPLDVLLVAITNLITRALT